jgi:hypothetical protein
LRELPKLTPPPPACRRLNAPHDKGLGPFASATGDSQLVLAVCHSLVSLPASAPEQQEERKLVGDPIELAAVKALQWGVEGAACTPGDVAGKLKLLDGLRVRGRGARPVAAHSSDASVARNASGNPRGTRHTRRS